jgi:RNA polymerase sigma factor (sigma-70 family)
MTQQQQLLTETYTQLSSELKRLSARFFRTNMQDGEDAFQSLWINLATTDTTEEIASAKEFVKSSLYNCCTNGLTKRMRERQKAERYFELHSRFAAAHTEIDEVDEARLDAIAKFTEQLTPRQQAVFSLLLQGKSIREIAKIQGNTYNTIKHNRRLVVEKLIKYFAENGEEFSYDKIS